MGRLSRYVVAVAAVLCLVSSAAAQGRAVLQISVEDELGGAIIGAKLTLIHNASGETHEASTDNAGRAAFEVLSTGEYVLKAQAPGFLRLQRTVTVGTAPAPLKLKLQIEVTDEVTIAGEAPAQRRTAADQNADTIKLGNGMLAGLPMPSDTQQLAIFINDFLSPLGKVSDPIIVVDGLEVSSASVPTAGVRQVLVNANPYSPEYRQLGKARVEIITEAGSTRHFNANVGLTETDSRFNARKAFASQDVSHKNFTESGFSGPLGHKLGSFLFSSQFLSNQQTGVVNALTPAGPLQTTTPTRLNSTTALGRADLRPTAADHLTISYNFVQIVQRNVGVGGLVLPELGIETRDTTNRFRLSLDSKLSAAASNQLRVMFDKSLTTSGAPATGPTLDVSGAFKGGGNQVFLSDDLPTLELQDKIVYVRRNHEFHFGGRLRLGSYQSTNADNFGGTFQFANLDLFAAGQPSVFTINQGSPTVRFSRNEGDLFFQDEMKLGSDVTLMAGARYDLAGGINDHANIGPRAAFAFAPGKQKTVFRAGAGLFYARFTDRIRQRSLLLDGVQTRTLVIEDPSYPDPFAAGQNASVLPSSIRLDPGLTIPHQFQITTGVERELRPGTLVAVEYARVRGYALFRSRNVNLPLPGTVVRPDPKFLNIDQVESTGTSVGNGLSFTVNSRIGKVLKISALYTFSRIINDTTGPFSLPADNFNLAAEMGRSDFDIRHKFNMASVVTLPRGFQLGAVTNISSGPPFDIITGFDNNGDGEILDRPLGVTRNTGQSPGYARLDLRLTKLFSVPRPAMAGKDNTPSRVEINLDAFNVLNRTNLDPPIDILSSPLFGQSNSAKPARVIQLSLKYRL